jgi:hypothetical protein
MKEKSWTSHALLGVKAIESLPSWERNLLPAGLISIRKEFSFLPDCIETSEELMGGLCLIMDQVYNPKWHSYCVMPNGRWIPHTIPDCNGFAAYQSMGIVSHRMLAKIIEYLMIQMNEALCNSNWQEIVIHAGVLAHFLQDAVAPSHTVNMQQVCELFPDPIAGRHLTLGKYLYAVCDRFEPQTPIMAGTSIQEAACKLTWETIKCVHSARKTIIPLLNAIYSKQPVNVCEDLLIPHVKDASWLSASAWHTIFSLHAGHISHSYSSSIRLIDLKPYFIHPGKYTTFPSRYLIRNQQDFCLKKGGFAMGGHSALKFMVGTGIYQSFSCKVSIDPECDSPVNLIFSIETDINENHVYSEDMEYGSERLLAVKLEPQKPSVELEVKIGNASTLILCARSFPLKDGLFNIPDIIISEALLIKKI